LNAQIGIKGLGRVVAALATGVLAACAHPSGAREPSPKMSPPSQIDPSVVKARADSARYPYTEGDIRFMSGMISHHAQAIKMAGWAASHGASPAVVTLAGRVTNAQQDEIAAMGRWLRARNLPVPEPNPNGMKMIMNGVEHEMLMPGMLTPEQMQQLDTARGSNFDELFLRFMIQHHNGAVSMVTDLFGTYGAAQDELVFKFASDVNIDQTTEIARMEKMLAAIIFEKNSK
jgi:uncharacterized protein (DUF305 family)